MSQIPGEVRAEPFFLKSGDGQRFCLFHPPAGPCNGALLYIHPFGEEMNRSRRMAALQARELAALGYGVLQLDLYGCGDSSGDFGDARWDLWKQDLATGAAWLAQRLGQPVVLWGLRLGALLALDYARTAPHPVAAMILWQPVVSGPAYLTQFLRLRMAGALLADAASEQTGTRALRAALQGGEVLEIGGYDLAPALAGAIDALDPAESMAPACPVHWFEAVGAAGSPLPPGSARVTSEWREKNVALQVHVVHCPPFWSTPEVTVSAEWLAATSAVLRVGSDGL
jgi:exosortase A-associated hydrolase 2